LPTLASGPLAPNALDLAWHQTLKNRILLENYYLPGDLKATAYGILHLTIGLGTGRVIAKCQKVI
jgi:hypothetical protein